LQPNRSCHALRATPWPSHAKGPKGRVIRVNVDDKPLNHQHTNEYTHSYVSPLTPTPTPAHPPRPHASLHISSRVHSHTWGGGVGRATCPLTHPCVLRLCPHLNVVQGVGLQKCNLQTWPATTVRRLRRDASSMSLSAWTHHSLLKATAPINFAQGRLASGAANREVRDTSQNSVTSTASPWHSYLIVERAHTVTHAACCATAPTPSPCAGTRAAARDDACARELH